MCVCVAVVLAACSHPFGSWALLTAFVQSGPVCFVSCDWLQSMLSLAFLAACRQRCANWALPEQVGVPLPSSSSCGRCFGPMGDVQVWFRSVFVQPGWMDGWMDGWTDGRMNGWTDGRMDGWRYGCLFIMHGKAMQCSAMSCGVVQFTLMVINVMLRNVIYNGTEWKEM